MRIAEIYTEALVPADLSHTEKKWQRDEIQQMKQNTPTEFDNRGSFYQGQEIPDDPHSFKKTQHYPMRGQEAGAEFFLEIIRRGLNGENPFLPVIYKVNTETSTEGKRPYKRHEFIVQTLLPLHLADAEMLYAALRLIVSKLDADSIKRDYLTNRQLLELQAMHRRWLAGDANVDDSLFNSRCKFVFMFIIRGVAEKQYKISDPELQEAVDLIRYVKRSHSGFRDDIHDANIMLRQTSVGVWPVFNDPLANVKLA